jgi:hypothetical protein
VTKYSHIISEVCRKPWAILPEKLAVIARFIRMSAAGEKLSEEEIQASMSAGPRVSPKGLRCRSRDSGVRNHLSAGEHDVEIQRRNVNRATDLIVPCSNE